MKTIKNLTVKMTYTVSLCNIEVTDDLYDALCECYDDGGYVLPTGFSDEEAIAAEWLGDNIDQKDAIDWEYEIEGFE